MPPKKTKPTTRDEAAALVKIEKNGFTYADTLFKLIMYTRDVNKKEQSTNYARSLILEYIKIYNTQIIDCREIKGILDMCLVEKDTRISLINEIVFIKSIHVNFETIVFFMSI